jgi:hypothetical protein
VTADPSYSVDGLLLHSGYVCAWGWFFRDDSAVVSLCMILETRGTLNEILAMHTGQPLEVIARDTERDRYLSAMQAKEYGLVDEVLIKPPKKAES